MAERWVNGIQCHLRRNNKGETLVEFVLHATLTTFYYPRIVIDTPRKPTPIENDQIAVTAAELLISTDIARDTAQQERECEVLRERIGPRPFHVARK